MRHLRHAQKAMVAVIGVWRQSSGIGAERPRFEYLDASNRSAHNAPRR
jgi:hypothetical protein